MQRLGIIAAVAIAVAVVASVMTRTGDGGAAPVSTDRSDSAPDPSATKRSPTSATVAEVGVDVDGARTAAVEAVALTGEVLMAGFTARRDLIAGFTTEAFGPRLAEETADQFNALLAELGDRDVDAGGLVAVEQPIATAAEVASGGGVVRVEVWSVLVLAVPGTGPARQVWRSVTLEMVPVGGRWLVDGWKSVAGPTPALAAEVSLDTAEAVAARIETARGGG